MNATSRLHRSAPLADAPSPDRHSARPPVRALAATVSLALLVAACGEGGGVGGSGVDASGTRGSDTPERRRLAAAINPAGWVAVTEPADALMQNLAIPADAPTRGMWSAPGPWPMNGLHQAVLPDGKVLTWGTTPAGDAQNGRWFDVWDPSRGLFDAAAHVTTYDPARQDSFCAAATYLPNGQLLITGGNGDVTSTTYTPSSGAMARGGNAADSRWYATMITLADGRPIILGGITPYTEGQYTNVAGALTQGLSSMTPEVYENGAWRSLLNAQSRTAWGPDNLRASMPKAWLAPDGRVFGISTDQMWYVDANAAGGQGTTTIVGGWKTPPAAGFTNDTAPNSGPTSTGVMYAPGRVLVVGGNAYNNGLGFAGSRQATVVDLNGGGAVVTEQPPMAFGRHYAGVVVLADGKVLASGGETRANNDPAFGAYAAETWNPATGRWTTMAASTVFRGYHSQASLLPNGTVLVTGGGTPGPVQLRGDVFYPPYLFRTVNGAAQLAPRPRLAGLSGLSHANGAQMQFDLAAPGALSQVALVGLSVGTHSFNSGQRFIPVSFTQDQFRVTATVPGSTLVPPGYYLLVAVDASGVPSRGTIVAVGQGVSAPQVPVAPYTPPTIGDTLTAPVITAGGAVTYTVAAQAGVTYSWDFGDGTPATPFGTTASITRTFAAAGVYGVTLTARDSAGRLTTRSFLQAVGTAATPGRPAASSAVALESRSGASARLWVANPDGNTVAVVDAATNARIAEIAVGASPRSVAIAPDGRVWVTNKDASSISIVSPASLSVVATVSLPRAAQPHGLAFAPGGSAFVALEATGQLLKLDPASGAVQATLPVGPNPRHVSTTANGALVLVSRFITNPLPGEGTATVDTGAAGGEVVVVNAGPMTANRTVVLRHSDRVDNENQGAGIPNYLSAAVISPDGTRAWVPSKQDNIRRGTLRNGLPLDFQNTVRAVSSRIDMATFAEDPAGRVDHDNASLASAAAYHPSGAYLFVTLETSRQVAVMDAVRGRELTKFDVGRAPQALAVSADGRRLYVQNFMDRSVSVIDLDPLVTLGEPRFPVLATVGTAGVERLPAQVLQGKQLFYDARDRRLARDAYMSCASCHNDAGHDGRTWDFTGLGEGLRNTPSLKGRGGMGQGFLHWSANFDEVQDFEGQIRTLAGGTGLMTDAQFNTGTRNTPLGDRKAGVSADLDALAAYLASLATVERSPLRNADGTPTAAAVAGRAVFNGAGCATCHAGTAFTISADAGALRNVGTLKPVSGRRLGAALTGLDVPTLRDVWATGPYLHDGSAPTLAAAVQAHAGNTVSGTDLANLVAYLQQIGSEEPAPGASAPTGVNLAPTATLATSFVSPWETLAAVNNNVEPASSADRSTGAYGNWQGEALYGRTDWVSFSWATPRTLNAFDVYWWNDGLGIATPTAALVEYWTGSAWVPVGSPGLALNTFNRLSFAPVSTTSIRVSMSSPRATGILEVRIWGTATGAPPPANRAPTVALTAPAAGSSVATGTATTLTATAADADGTVTLVEFYAGATLLGTDTTAPYSLGWTPSAAGAVTLTARAIDNTGASTTSAAVGVTVTAPPSSAVPPSTAVQCATEGGTCTLPAGATATVWYGAGTSWAVRTGVTGSIACTNAVFGDPIVGTVKSCRSVVTSGGAPANVAPTVSLTAPSAGAAVVAGTAVTLSATAADTDGTVARVEFYAGATLVGTDTTAPYGVGWTPATAGSYALTARAFDNAGASTTSAVVTLIVTTGPATLPLPSGALAEWTFDTTLGMTAPDSSGNGRALTLGGGVTMTASGRSGGALQFTGVGSPAGATTAAPVVDTAASFSVSGWIRFDQLPECWNQIMASQDGVAVSGFYLGIVPPCGGGLPRATFAMLGADADASATFRIVDTATVVTGRWYHLVAVRDASANTMALYVDGRLVGTLANTTRWAANGPFAVGRARFSGGPRDPAYAAIDGVRAYGRALTAAEVTTLLQAAR
jgi:YVTN family beta-propeller protein